MLTVSLNLYVFLGVNKFLTINNLFKYIYIYIKIEAIVLNVGNLRIEEAKLIATLHPQIENWFELETEYINLHPHSLNKYLNLKIKEIDLDN